VNSSDGGEVRARRLVYPTLPTNVIEMGDLRCRGELVDEDRRAIHCTLHEQQVHAHTASGELVLHVDAYLVAIDCGPYGGLPID
jgi:hypothetical protein